MTPLPNPGPNAFFLEGGPIAALLIHGFPGSPADVWLPGHFLHARGVTISAPLLPGHGTRPAELNRVRWQDWIAHVEEALAHLSARCKHTFVGGLSLGSLIAIILGARHPELAGIALYSPAVALRNRLIYLTPLMKYPFPFWPADRQESAKPQVQLSTYNVIPTHGAHQVLKIMRVARRSLPQVTAPTIIFHSPFDQDIAPHSARLTHDRLGSADKELVTLDLPGHNILVLPGWETVAERTAQFIAAHAGKGTG